MGNAIMGVGYADVGAEGLWEISVLFPQFCWLKFEPKTAQKKKKKHPLKNTKTKKNKIETDPHQPILKENFKKQLGNIMDRTLENIRKT